MATLLMPLLDDVQSHRVSSGCHKEYEQHRYRYNNRTFILAHIDVISAYAYWLLTMWWSKQGLHNAEDDGVVL